MAVATKHPLPISLRFLWLEDARSRMGSRRDEQRCETWGLWAEGVSQGEKGKWDEARAGVERWHCGDASRADETHKKLRFKGERCKRCTYCSRQKAECSLGALKPEFRSWKRSGPYSLLHPVCNILRSGSVVFIMVKELPLSERQQSIRKSVSSRHSYGHLEPHLTNMS